MGTVSIWLSGDIERCLEEVAKYEGISTGKYIKKLIKERFELSLISMDKYYETINDLYNWHYYFADVQGKEEKYTKRILIDENSTSILRVLSQYDSLRINAKTLGYLMTAVALRKKRELHHTNEIYFIKQVKNDLIQNFKYIRNLPLIVNNAKILWMRTIEKIRDMSYRNEPSDWEKYAFTAGIQAITKTSEISEANVFSELGFGKYENEYSELFSKMKSISTMLEHAKLVYKCSDCHCDLSNKEVCPQCGGDRFFSDLVF